MALFWKDWLKLKKAIQRAMFNHDMRYQGMSYDQAKPYLTAQLNKLAVTDLERFMQIHGIRPSQLRPSA